MKNFIKLVFLVLFIVACSKKEKTTKNVIYQEQESKQEQVVDNTQALDSIALNKSIALKHPSNFDDILVYTVQIGAFSQPNPVLETNDNITTEKEGNMIKYRFGNFATYKEAKAFKSDIISLYKDAFIVPIYKGNRIDIKQALTISKEPAE